MIAFPFFQRSFYYLYYFILLFGGLATAVAQVSVQEQGGDLVYRLEQPSFLPEKAKKDLSSGVSTQIVILAKLVEGKDRIVTQQIVSMDSKFNLWEENFRLQYSDGRKQIFKKQIELENEIQNPGPFILSQMSELKNDAFYRVEVIQSLNPLGADRLESVRNWVIGQKVSSRAASSPKDQAVRGAAPDSAFSELFYGLWRRSSQGEILVGEVRRELRSKDFSKASLKATKEGKMP